MFAKTSKPISGNPRKTFKIIDIALVSCFFIAWIIIDKYPGVGATEIR
jgi:hypothetical protein